MSNQTIDAPKKELEESVSNYYSNQILQTEKNLNIESRRQDLNKLTRRASISKTLATLTMLGICILITAVLGNDYQITNILLIMLGVYALIEFASLWFNRTFSKSKT
jgi:hypothetical protein